MIAPPEGWHARVHDDGLVLTAAEGPAAGVMYYAERVRPLATVRDVIAAYPAPPGFVLAHREPIERLLTDEGEHAAMVALVGTIDGAPVERVFGFVFGDDYYARLVAVTASPAHFAAVRATVRALVRADYHVLGKRRRRYAYATPAGFQPVAGWFDTTWYPLDYPARATSIVVAAALPQQRGLRDALVAAAEQRRPSASGALPEPLGTPQRLAGRLYTLAPHEGLRTWLALLEDDAYIYPVRLDTRATETQPELEAFAAVIASIEPVPQPRATIDTTAFGDAVGHWTM
ncbi:MAG: hypothetical protein K8W52_03465 [Deltaproteobacteria bacterium]|nr:hypothetical protein [Deltaproteobacteria bacterium]